MFSSKKILVVEDDSLIRGLYVRALKKQGYDVYEAADGEEAYSKMVEGGYDLILLDIMLPKMNGFDILKKLKEQTPPKKENKKIVILTNLDEDTTQDDSNFFGADGYLVKNKVDITKLSEELSDYLV